MFQVHSTRFNSWTVRWNCDVCADGTWPVLRIAGYPSHEAMKLVDEGRAVLKGCLVNPGDDEHDYECPNCGAGVDVPIAYQDEDIL